MWVLCGPSRVVDPLAGRDGGTSCDTSSAEPAAAGIRHATGQDLATPRQKINLYERIAALHDASTIAAVILEPMQGSAGVIVRAVCDPILERGLEIARGDRFMRQQITGAVERFLREREPVLRFAIR